MAKRKLGRGLDVLIGGNEGTRSSGDRPEESPEPPRRPSGRSGEDPGERGAATTEGTARSSKPSKDASSSAQRAPRTGGSSSSTSSKTGKRSARSTPGENTASGAGTSDDGDDGLKLRRIAPGDVEVNPHQPRREFPREELEGLKASVGQEGLLQPVLVRKTRTGYQLIAGERRLRAAQELQLESIPARVVEIDDERLLELALIENVHRSDLNPVELAEAYRALQERNGWSQDELAARLGLSRSQVGNTLRFLELPEAMRTALGRGQITPGHAKVLLSVSDEKARQALFDKIAEENLSVRELESARDETSDGTPQPEDGSDRRGRSGGRRGGRGREKKPYIVSLEEELSEALGVRVRITERRGGKGVVGIEFYSKEDFERLKERLLG